MALKSETDVEEEVRDYIVEHRGAIDRVFAVAIGGWRLLYCLHQGENCDKKAHANLNFALITAMKMIMRGGEVGFGQAGAFVINCSWRVNDTQDLLDLNIGIDLTKAEIES